MDVIESFGTVLTIVALLISVPSAAGAVYYIVRGSLQTAQIEGLRRDNDDQDKRLARKELEITDLEEENTDLKEQNKILKAENVAVWEQLTQKADVEGVKALLTSIIELITNKKDPA